MILRSIVFCFAGLATALRGFQVLTKQCHRPGFPSTDVLLCGSAAEGVELVLSEAPKSKPTTETPPPTDPPATPASGSRTSGGRHIQWTREPFCTQILGNINEPLCVYVSETFASTRGLALLSTPSYADRLSKLQAFQSAGNDFILPSEQKWTTKAIPGRGIGMVATRHINHGELVVVSTPVLLMHDDVQKLIDTNATETLLRRAISYLPPDTGNAYMSLATSLNVPEIKAQDVIVTNAFECHAAGKAHIAVCPEPSRMNHDCSPNAIYHFDHDRLTHYTYAVKDIVFGEEITTTYSDPVVLGEERRANLRNAFRFECKCDRCMEHGTFRGSDARVRKILRIQERLKDWSGAKHTDELGQPTTAMAEELVWLYKLEGLWSHIGTAYAHAAISYSAAGNKEKAEMFADKAIEAMERKDGPGGGADGPAMYQLRDAMKKRRKHWSWGLRV